MALGDGVGNLLLYSCHLASTVRSNFHLEVYGYVADEVHACLANPRGVRVRSVQEGVVWWVVRGWRPVDELLLGLLPLTLFGTSSSTGLLLLLLDATTGCFFLLLGEATLVVWSFLERAFVAVPRFAFAGDSLEGPLCFLLAEPVLGLLPQFFFACWEFPA